MPSAIMSTQTSTYLEAVKQRRSVYGVTDDVAVSDDRILEIANAVIQTCPSAWNMQGTRMLISLGQEHKHFWNTVIASAKPSVVESQGEDAWKRNRDRFKSFQAAYGTVRGLFVSWSRLMLNKLPVADCVCQISLFEDHDSIEQLSKKFAKVPLSVLEGYAEHSNAMHQITLWTALELEGLGASLQHSQNVPGVEEGIKSAFGIPESWAIKAEIVFGGLPEDLPAVPEKKSVLETVRVFK
jgi:predicted oxidoreductase (fatty acid repression mutant protein)